MFKTVLFPIDNSRETREAVDTIVDIVQKYSSRLVLLSVVEASSSEEESSSSQGMSSTQAVGELLEGVQKLFAEQNIEAETMEREGMPAFIICDVADEIDAELIAMGCRGLGLTEEGVAESVSNRVVNLAPCPVLIVPWMGWRLKVKS